jgi:hypothetical protein
VMELDHRQIQIGSFFQQGMEAEPGRLGVSGLTRRR